MTIRCIDCGKFIPLADMQSNMASFHHEPSSDRGPEINEWTCAECVLEAEQCGPREIDEFDGVIAR